MVVQVGSKSGRDRLGNFERGELDGALTERFAGEG